jgi:ribosomal protein RSM22 (predicted rRNA methylase)
MATSTIEKLEEYLAKQLLSAKAYAQYRTGDVSKSELSPFAAELRKISQAYVTHAVGGRLDSPIHGTIAAEAYALYYTIINAAKIVHLVPLMSFKETAISMLDVGCGPGTAGLALLAAGVASLNLTCVEQSGPMRVVAERLLSGWSGEAKIDRMHMKGSLGAISQDSFDLVVAGNVLAELEENESVSTLRDLVSRVSEGGYLLLLEPGQQLHTRRLMAIRDIVCVDYPELVPQFPCLRSDPCPMLLASSTDWCHGTIEWRQPKLNAQFDDLLSFNKHRIKYSAFLFQRGGTLKDGVRVLSNPSKERAGIETLLCGKDLYGISRIRKGSRSEFNRPLEKASVFNRLTLSSPCVGDLPEDVVVTAVPNS